MSIHSSTGEERYCVLSAWFKTKQESRPVVCVVTPQGGMLAHVKSEGEEVWRSREARFNSGQHAELVVRIYADVAGFLETRGKTPAGIAWVDDVQVWGEAEFARLVSSSADKDRAVADRCRVRVLKALASLEGA